MKDEKTRKERLSIYLAKTAFTSDNQLVNTESAKPPIELASLEGKARLYIKREFPKDPPLWTKLLLADPAVPQDAFGRGNTVGAVMILSHEGRTFALTFGSGHHLIKEDAFERDFGLRVTLNSVSPDKLRSLDKASYEHNPLNSRTQSTRDVDIFDLNINSELDILFAVAGITSVPEFGTVVAGRDAFTLAVETTLGGLLAILTRVKQKYEAKLPPQFSWVDNVQRVKDKDIIEILDLELDDALKKGGGGSVIWLGEPEIVDWESQICYSFDLLPKSPRPLVLQLSDLQAYMKAKGVPFTVPQLKEQKIHINNAEYQPIRTWSAYRCLYAEMVMGPDQFILRNGLWFRVETVFANEVDAALGLIPTYGKPLPMYAHEREEDYNEHVATLDGTMHLMDKKTAKIGGPYDKLEFCDLIKDGTDLLHVKFYRSSATLSHLFAQGYVAAEAFVKDEAFRAAVNNKLPTALQLKDPKARPNPANYRVVYAVATTKKLPVELPFFSKVTLKNAAATLRALDYKVEICAINVDPVLLVTKKIKPKKAP